MKKKYKFLTTIVAIIIFFAILPDATKLQKDDYSKVITDKDGNILRVFLNSNQQWILPPEASAEVPEKLKQTILFFEDKYFKYHFGFNPVSIIRAAYLNLKYKRIVSGGSTITMQLIRITKYRKRTFLNKIFELFLAIKIEIKYSKKEILKMYLERAPFGGNVIGYTAASMKYFRKKPKKLSWSEAAVLAVLPNSPGLISPGKNQSKLVKKRNHLLKNLMLNNKISEDFYKSSIIEPAPKKVYSFEFSAPHFTRYIKTKSREPIIKSTIDSKIQIETNAILKEYQKAIAQNGVSNCSAIIIDKKTNSVRSWLGSHDFNDFHNSGQVDGVLAKRSSGSIFKPFLYASAIDEGIIIPQSKMLDVPTFYRGFSPDNYSGGYSGIVSAHQALTRSLNIPAVRLLQKIGVYQFYSFLEDAGATTLFRPSDDYGLSLIIGGAETNLLDLAKFYSGLGNLGNFQHLKMTDKDRDSNEENQLLSRGASYLIINSLEEVVRPGFEQYRHIFESDRKIAWKTGTSYGNRDAWAVGVTPDWVVCVWVGNFSGDSNPHIIGRSLAGPLLFKLINSLPAHNSDFEIPIQDLKNLEICKTTGYIAGKNCPQKVDCFAPNSMKQLAMCPYHKKIIINTNTGFEVCSLCWDSENNREKIIMDYPPQVTELIKSQIEFSEKPTHNPNCKAVRNENIVEIIYPRNNMSILIPKEVTNTYEKLVLRAANKNKKTSLWWYINSEYYGKTDRIHEIAVHLNPGKYEAIITDDYGNSFKTVFEIVVKD